MQHFTRNINIGAGLANMVLLVISPSYVSAICMIFSFWMAFLCRTGGALGPAAPVKEITAGEDYNRRWEDPEYVAMIHKTRKVEKETLGEAKTECECKACNPPVLPRPPKGPSGVSSAVPSRPPICRVCNEYMPYGSHDNVHGNTDQPRTEIVEGWVHRIPNYVPHSARCNPSKSYESNGHFVLWTWFTPEGNRMGYKSFSLEPASRYEIEAWSRPEPIATVPRYRTANEVRELERREEQLKRKFYEKYESEINHRRRTRSTGPR